MTAASAHRVRGFIVGCALTCLTLLTASALVLTGIGVMNTAAAEAPPPEPHTPTSIVETGAVVSAVSGIIRRAPTSTVAVPAPESAQGRAVITRPGVRAQQNLSIGTVLATVNERPVIATSGAMPFYRALGPGAQGQDVSQLQAFLLSMGLGLGQDFAGHFDTGTASAVYALYAQLGYQPVDATATPIDPADRAEAGVPRGELVALGNLQIRALDDCGRVGQPTEGIVCTIASRTGTATITLPPEEAAGVRPGMRVRVVVGGTTVSVRLGEVAAADPDPESSDASVPLTGSPGTPADPAGSDNLDPGSDLGTGAGADAEQGSLPTVFSLRGKRADIAALRDGLPARIILEQSPPDALRVVGIALRTTAGSGATWVNRANGRRIPVEVGVCADGYCAIDGEIEAGTVVALPTTVPGLGADAESGADGESP